MDNLNILMASPEAVPFVKTGGLADVTGALPDAIASLDHKIKVILPLYKSINKDSFGLKPYPSFPKDLNVTVNGEEYKVDLYTAGAKNDNCEFLFVDNKYFFERDGIYLDNKTGKDFPDNDERYIFYARAVLETAKAINFKPNIIHLHDWQAAMISGYLSTLNADDEFYSDSRTIFTIHNIGYQGHFESETFPKLGLPDNLYGPGSPFEYWDHVNFLKIGITTSDIITTVSEKYAEEIQSGNEFGFGMEGILMFRKQDIFGVLNGVDYNIWSPENDELIPVKYSIDNLSLKEKNKFELLKHAGLPVLERRVPLIGVISRLADQKGFDLIAKIADKLFSQDIQFVLLGTGSEHYHNLFTELEGIYHGKLKAFLTFDNRLAHLIEAGSDMFLMPSRYEPCGLNQMYSLKYGTVPIVRETGGLADTITDFNKNPQEGNGFVFTDYKPSLLMESIQRALAAYKDKDTWSVIQQRGMSADFSWDRSAKKYEKIYHLALSRNKNTKSSKFHPIG